MCNLAASCRARYVAYYHQNALGGELPLALGWSARLLEHDQLSELGDPYLVLKLNSPQIDELAELPGSFRYLANYVPVGEFGAGSSFEEIAEQAQGRELLGYLKADVDNLGMLFAHGLRRTGGESYDTAAHIAALSRELDLFFSGWVQHLLSRTPEYRSCYTIIVTGGRSRSRRNATEVFINEWSPALVLNGMPQSCWQFSMACQARWRANNGAIQRSGGSQMAVMRCYPTTCPSAAPHR